MNDKGIKLLAKYIKTNRKLKEINNYLYNHTELFEGKYRTDFEQELFLYLAGQITKYTKIENNILQRMSNNDIEKLNLQLIMED